MKTYVFPGQGSQVKGMGEDLFDEFPELTKQADKILGYSIKELCLQDPKKNLNQTQFTQPALYVVNALSFRKHSQDGKNLPDFVAGHSLGEYNALEAAGVISFEDGLKLVQKRGELMSQAKDGGMAAVINCGEEKIRQTLKDAKLENIDIANLNAPSQIVISGLKDDIGKSQEHFEKAGALFIPLNTSGAFHSKYMQDAGQNFEKFLKKFKFSKPKIPVIANVDAKPYELKNVASNLTKQISSCVQWTQSVFYLLDQGEMEFQEMGVGDVLTKLVAKIKKDWTPSGDKAAKAETSKPAADKGAKSSIASTGSPKEYQSMSAEDLVAYWNNTYQIGTKVKSEVYDQELETRTNAVVLFGHRAAVYMKGYNGYFDIKEITPVN